MIKVGVIFGGESVEHEVSIISALQAMENINEEKYDVVPIYISKDRVWYTGKFLRDMNVYKDMDLLIESAIVFAVFIKSCSSILIELFSIIIASFFLSFLF